MDRTFAADGVEIRPAVLRSRQIACIQEEVSVDHEVLRRTGIRNLEKKFRSIAQVAADASVLSIAASLLGKTPRLVRALFFDKTGERNWFVAWHQDRTVTLNQRFEIEEFACTHRDQSAVLCRSDGAGGGVYSLRTLHAQAAGLTRAHRHFLPAIRF